MMQVRIGFMIEKAGYRVADPESLETPVMVVYEERVNHDSYKHLTIKTK